MFFIIRAGTGFTPVIVESLEGRNHREYWELSLAKDTNEELFVSGWKPGEFNSISPIEARYGISSQTDDWNFAEFTDRPFKTLEAVHEYVKRLRLLYELSQEKFLFRLNGKNVEGKLFFFAQKRPADQVNVAITTFDTNHPWQPAGCTTLLYFGKVPQDRFGDIDICAKPVGTGTYVLRDTAAQSYTVENDSWGGPNMMILAVREPSKA